MKTIEATRENVARLLEILGPPLSGGPGYLSGDNEKRIIDRINKGHDILAKHINIPEYKWERLERALEQL